MAKEIKSQSSSYIVLYVFFGVVGLLLMIYYLSNTIIHFTTDQQFPISSFERFPLTYIIFPAEVFSFIFTIYFVYNLINGNKRKDKPRPMTEEEKTNAKVALLVPVYNEPSEIVNRTLKACSKISWKGGTKIYLLDDSTTEEDKKNMQELSKKFNAKLIRRDDRIGYKAGNINNAIKNHIKEKYFAVFDSDQAPEPDFLQETMDHFTNPDVGFVQTPQYFIEADTLIERAQKLGTNIFYQAQCQSKAKDHSMPFCGTNAVIRTDVFKLVNGLSYYTSTEDIEIGIRINEAGYYGEYVSKVLVKGYATVDFQSYASQQYRWANGNMAILRQSFLKVIFGKLSFRQQIHTLFTTGWWLIGLVSFVYIFIPLIALLGLGTHHTWLPNWVLGVLFINVILGVLMIYFSLKNRDEDDRITWLDALLQYSLITNSMFIYIRASITALLKKYIGFVRTNKERQVTDYKDIKWNILFGLVCFALSVFSLYKASIAGSIEQLRTYLPISIWLLFYSVVLGSSIIFVGNPVGVKSTVSAKQSVSSTNENVLDTKFAQYGSGVSSIISGYSRRSKTDETNTQRRN